MRDFSHGFSTEFLFSRTEQLVNKLKKCSFILNVKKSFVCSIAGQFVEATNCNLIQAVRNSNADIIGLRGTSTQIFDGFFFDKLPLLILLEIFLR